MFQFFSEMTQGYDPFVSLKKKRAEKTVRFFIKMTQGNDTFVSSAKVIVHD